MSAGILSNGSRRFVRLASSCHYLRGALGPSHKAISYARMSPSSRVRSLSMASAVSAAPAAQHDRRSVVTIVEVGPRDGLQNERQSISPSIKAELVNRLARAGMPHIEAGSFVSPKWVPQMAGTPDVLAQLKPLPGTRYSILVPNLRGLEDFLALLRTSPKLAHIPPSAFEVALFIAASDAFSRANTNCTVAEAIARSAPVAERAAREGLRLRGYVSVVISCPYSGRVDPRQVRDVARALRDMGCAEISLGDTNGTGTPATVLQMLNRVVESVPVEMLAGHFHDTYGSALANIFAALSVGVRTFDASIGGLGGCPYSPGATGNVATEDVVHALQGSQYTVRGRGARQPQPQQRHNDSAHPQEDAVAAAAAASAAPVDLAELVRIGAWISDVLGRENASRAGRAYIAAEKRRAAVAAAAASRTTEARL